MKRLVAAHILVSLVMLSENMIGGQTAGTPANAGPSGSDGITLPNHVVWETNSDDPPIGSPVAMRGSTFNFFITSYPLTFRLMGSEFERRVCRLEPALHDEFSARGQASCYRPIYSHHGDPLVRPG